MRQSSNSTSKSSQSKTSQSTNRTSSPNKTSSNKSSTSSTRSNATNSTLRSSTSGTSQTSTSMANRNVSSGTKQNTTQATSVYNDKQILQDTLMSQKHITDAYNTFAGECANDRLRSTMLSILNDEHNIQATIFSSMQTNGWYKTEPATTKSIQKAKQKVTSN